MADTLSRQGESSTASDRKRDMTRVELLEMLRNGEDSHVEFKRDDVQNFKLAKELVAFLNLDGGTLLLGVEDDGSISGVTRPRLEEWMGELCRAKISPPVVPLLHWVRDADSAKDVLAVRVSAGLDKPYARVHNSRKTYYIRVGSSSREASREELGRMYQASGYIRHGLRPVSGADITAFDRRRLRDYCLRLLRADVPEDGDREGWEGLLANLELMTESGGVYLATVDGLLLFGKSPARYLSQAGVRAICYTGTEPDYATRADEVLRGPLVPLAGDDGRLVENGLVEQAWDFVRRNTTPTARLDGPRRVDGWDFPEQVVREAIVNALVHRDYSIAGTDVTVAIFADRMDVESPGRLPNTVTVDRMKGGVRYARNQTLVNIMRDYRYVDARGMGVRMKMIPGMRDHNGTDPEFIAEEHRFTVRLWKTAEQQGGDR